MNTTNLPQTVSQGKGATRHPSSSGAYFDAKHESTHKTRLTDWTKSTRWNREKLSPAQSRRIRHEKPAQITVYADMMTLKYPDYTNGKVSRRTDHCGGGIRGDVVGFSRASRKRMIEFMARIREDGDMYFVTMTYDDLSWITHWGTHQDQWEAFRRRFERAYPGCKALWRVEFKQRLSGLLVGNFVPHFHMLVWTGGYNSDENKQKVADSLQTWGVKAWGEILETEHPNFIDYGFHVQPVRSRKHAYSYVSKYIGKEASDDIPAGRRWGRIGTFNTSSSETITLTDDEAINFRRLIKRWLKTKNPKFASRFARGSALIGFTILGLGDTAPNGMRHGIGCSFEQFIVEVKRQSAEREAREMSRNS